MIDLNSPKWSELHHAYGAATTLPQLKEVDGESLARGVDTMGWDVDGVCWDCLAQVVLSHLFTLSACLTSEIIRTFGLKNGMNRKKPLNLRTCYSATFARKGDILVTLSRDVVVWDVQRRAKRFRIHPLSHPASCSVHPEDERIVVKNTLGHIALVDSTDGALTRMLADGKRNEGSNVEYANCGNYIVDGSWSGVLTVRCASTGTVVFEREFPNEMITQVAKTACGKQWYITHSPKAFSPTAGPPPLYVSLWTWPFTSPTGFLNSLGEDAKAVSVSDDGHYLCVLSLESVSVLSLHSKQLIASTPYAYGGTTVTAVWSPDNQEIGVVKRGAFVFHEALTLLPSKTVDLPFASALAYSPDGNLIALGGWEGGMLLERWNE